MSIPAGLSDPKHGWAGGQCDCGLVCMCVFEGFILKGLNDRCWGPGSGIRCQLLESGWVGPEQPGRSDPGSKHLEEAAAFYISLNTQSDGVDLIFSNKEVGTPRTTLTIERYAKMWNNWIFSLLCLGKKIFP